MGQSPPVESPPVESQGLASFTEDELFRLRDAAHGLLCTITKASTVTATLALERAMLEAISSAWEQAASEAFNSEIDSLRGEVTGVTVDGFTRRLGAKLKSPLTKKRKATIEKHLKSIWTTAKNITAKEVKFIPAFGTFDAKAVQVLAEHQVFWVNGFYDSHLSERIRAVASDVLIERGLSHKEAGEALARELGIVEGGGTRFAASVPSRYAGNPQLYFEQVASNASHRARTFSTVRVMDEVGIITYTLTNPLDRRTGQRCQILAGQVFTVAAGVKQMSSILSATTPDEVKEIAPWLTPVELQGVLGNAKRGSVSASRRLAEAGVILPPFHGKCVEGSSLIYTEYGTKRADEIEVGDKVLTHKGRYKVVTEVMVRQHFSLFIRFVVHSKEIGLTFEHPVLVECENGFKFIQAGELSSSSRVAAVREELQDMWDDNVSCEVEGTSDVLLQRVQEPSKVEGSERIEASKQEQVANVRVQSLQQRVSKDREVCTEEEIRTPILFFGVQSAKSNLLLRENVPGLRGVIYDNSFQRQSDVQFCMSERVDAYREIEESKFSRENVGKSESHVREIPCDTESPSVGNGVQRDTTPEREQRTSSGQDYVRDGNSILVRGREVSASGGFDLQPGLLHTRVRFLDRDLIERKAKRQEKAQVIQKVNEELCDADWPEGTYFTATAISDLNEQLVNMVVYNFEVEEDHTYVVQGVVVHNCRTEAVIIS